MKYTERTLEKFLKNSAKNFPVILITGPRQVGKTTFLKHLGGKKRKYVTLDDPGKALLAKQEPKMFLEKFKPPVLIDEIQYAPELLPFIKMYVDTHKTSGLFWLTGSQQFHIMSGVTESLAGRVGILNLSGLSLFEQQGLAKYDEPFLPTKDTISKREKHAKPFFLKEIYTKIWKGSFPAIILKKNTDWELFYSSYIQTYLQRDIKSLANVGNETAFLKFLRSAAARTGQLLNLADMSRDAEISPNTAKNWLSILQASGIIYLLEPYYNNLTKRMTKTPKLYFMDTGLACYLTDWLSPDTLESGAMSGAILETFIVVEIIKSYWHNGKQAKIFYYRDKDKKEIDLLIIQNQTIYPIEIKKTGSPNKDSIRHFSLLEKFQLKIGEGAVICFTDTVMPITKDVNAVPVGLI
jgi:predicted AAA+ superfamily ATPase